MCMALTIRRTALSGIVVAGILLLLVDSVQAHCDSSDGPVIPEANAALDDGDVTPILKWVTKENEAEIRTAFAKAVAVRATGAEAKELADKYFIETLVRLHRAGEGAPYTGIKDEAVEPIVAMADQALAGGSAEEMIKKISAHLAGSLRDKFEKAAKARENKDTSVEAGREFVEAYVTYVHYVERIHAAIVSVGAHDAEARGSADVHGDNVQ